MFLRHIRKSHTSGGLSWWPLLLLPLFAGCVQAELDIILFPDGSGEFRTDIAYSTRKWMPLFGDPYASFSTPAGFAGMMPPGFVAWSQPEISAGDGWRHIRTTAFFDDLRKVVFPAKHGDEPYVALGFSGDIPAGDVMLRADLDSVLARPVPLPSPEELGMDDVSIPDAVMQRVRGQMGTILSGLDVRLTLQVPGTLERADGFDSFEGNQALIEVDAPRGAAAFQQRAGVLVDADALTGPDPRWTWTPAPISAALLEAHLAARAAALLWWSD